MDFDRLCPDPPWDLDNATPIGLVGIGGKLTSATLLRAYSEGVFPWYSLDDPILWWSPNPRAIFDIHTGIYISRRLARTIRSGKFEIRMDTAFREVMSACGVRPEGTWITPEMLDAYTKLHEEGFAHCVETWRDGKLVGGVYGVALCGLFAAESMFYRESDASKVALAALFDHLRSRGYTLVDTQMLTEHTYRMGAFEIDRALYLEMLKYALQQENVTFHPNQIPKISA